jgi:anaerobic ribonucleoside-triphosphate reductase activating protein
VSELCKLIKRETNKTIIVYTGMTLQELKVQYPYLSCLSYVDYLIDGRFEKENVTEKLEKRGSKNQKCYKIKHYGVTNVAVDVTESYF